MYVFILVQDSPRRFSFPGAPQTEAVFAVPEFGEAEDLQSHGFAPELLRTAAVRSGPQRKYLNRD
jgi:hypothetical protein